MPELAKHFQYFLIFEIWPLLFYKTNSKHKGIISHWTANANYSFIALASKPIHAGSKKLLLIFPSVMIIFFYPSKDFSDKLSQSVMNKIPYEKIPENVYENKYNIHQKLQVSVVPLPQVYP